MTGIAWKPDVRNWANLLGYTVLGVFLMTLGYCAPHPSVRVVQTTQYKIQKVYVDPSSPISINTVGDQVFYRDKTTGCTWAAREGRSLELVVIATDTCKEPYH